MGEVLKNQHQKLTFGVRSCVYTWQPCDSNVYSLTQRIQHRPPKAFKHLNPPIIQNSGLNPLLTCCSKSSTILYGHIMREQRLRLPLHNMEQFMRTQEFKNTRERLREVIWLTEKIYLASGLYVSQIVSLSTRFENTAVDFVSCFWHLHEFWSSFSKS